MKIVVEQNDGVRIDKFIADNSDYSRQFINKMMDEDKVLVNGVIKKPSYKVCLNDIIDIDDSYKVQSTVEPVEMDIDIVYEDDDLMVINKPSGLVVHPGHGNYDNTLVNGLMHYTNELSSINGSDRVGIVHRIDKDTSGLMIVCKSDKAHAILAEDFKNHSVKRTYYALLCGVTTFNKATVDAPIKRDPQNFNKMGVFEDGKKAITHLEVVKKYKNYTLVKLNLETGRTHQIRVHMKYIGYPIYNDPVYNKEHTPFGQFLHSKELDFVHPITKEKMHFEIDLPEEFAEFIDNLE